MRTGEHNTAEISCNGGSNIGIIAGSLSGKIIASGTSGSLVGEVFASGGGLAGTQEGGEIVASTASVDIIKSAENSELGGLVGIQKDARILASYANTKIMVDGYAVNGGGLVGRQDHSNARIAASYSISKKTRINDASSDTRLGGLVGIQNIGSILASYASSDIHFNSAGYVGRLVGDKEPAGIITESYGFANFTGRRDLLIINNADATSSGITKASDLTNSNVGVTWNQASSNTLGVWEFGDFLLPPRPPMLKFSDYDGGATGFICEGAVGSTTSSTIIIPRCTEAVPEQVF